jgi:hypothetical protein
VGPTLRHTKPDQIARPIPFIQDWF